MTDIDRADISGRFDELIARYLPDPQVTEGTGFGSSRGLRVGGKIFAIFGERELTVKLPRARVDELVDAGIGTRFDPGHGRLMREWLTVSTRHATEWERLADDALRFVRTGDRRA
jgi:hypothetical protein